MGKSNICCKTNANFQFFAINIKDYLRANKFGS